MDLRRFIIISGLCCCLKQSFTFTVTQMIVMDTTNIAVKFGKRFTITIFGRW